MGKTQNAFFAYPSSKPTLSESIKIAIEELNKKESIFIQSWEQCKIGGKLIIFEICSTIDQSDIFMADLTGLNANVMFELGYAIAKNKRIWLIFDTSVMSCL